MPTHVAVIGPGQDASSELCATAEAVGRLLAEHGCVVFTGGLGGVMAAAAKGATGAGGTAVGLLPGHDRRDAAPELTAAIPTGLGELRNALLVRTADAVIAIGGSWGTLSEIALAMRTGTPVIAIGGWHITDDSSAEMAIPRAADADEAVRFVLAAVHTGAS
jgi:uncharacterized protein (TIGR00725 family)